MVRTQYAAKNISVTPTLSDSIVKTGSTVKIKDDLSLDVVLLGDVNKDGEVDVLDAQRITKKYIKGEAFDRLESMASNLNGDNEVDINDAQRIKNFTMKPERYSSNGYAESNSLPDEVIETVEKQQITSFEVSNDGTIKVKLNKPITAAKFYVNGTIISPDPEPTDNTYTITGSNLKLNEENTLVVTDESHTFELTKTFVYKNLIAPNNVLILAGTGNAINNVNASNVNSATIQVEFTGGNRNELPVTLEVTIDDDDDNKTIPVKATKQLTTKDVNVEINNVNLSSLNDGTLTLTAVIKDSEGNISESISEDLVSKKAKNPEVKYNSISRSGTSVTISGLSSTNEDDTIYYVVKGINENAPTVDEILRAHTSTTEGITLSSEFSSSACVVYVVAQTTTGTESENVLAIKVAKDGADHLSNEGLYIRKVESTDATYTFGYTDAEKENADGFVGYKIVLKKSKTAEENYTVVKEYEVKKGEDKKIDLFDILKEQEDANEYKYKLTICALADNEEYVNSVDATTEPTITIEEVLDEISVTLNKVKKTLTWTINGDVANVKDYTIQVAKYDKDDNYENKVASVNVPSLVEYDISKIVEENGVGTYKFTVIANAKDNVLMANSSADASDMYNQGKGINNLSAEIKDGSVSLKGTLLDDEDIYDTEAHASISYKLYYKLASSDSYTNAGTVITALPDTSIAVSSLNPGTEYTFMIETTVDGNKYYSNEATIKTEKTAIVVEDATYEKQNANSPVVTLESGNITYKDGILYIKDESSNLVQYSSEVYPEVSDIISILDQMGEEDTISIDSVITALTLNSDDEKATNYDLSNVPKNASVTINGNSTYKTTVKGQLNEITLATTSAKFDLSQLTVEKVNIEANKVDLVVNADTVLSFGASCTEATINGVKISESAIRDINVTTNGFSFTGSENELTVDASAAKTKIDLEFVGTNQKGLVITSNETNGVAILTNRQNINGLEIKTGKVDVSKAVYNCLTIGKMAGQNKVTLVTGKNSDKDARGVAITISPETLKWLGYSVVSNKDEIATYDTDNGKDIISFTFNSESEETDWIKLTKIDSETLSSTQINNSTISSIESSVGDLEEDLEKNLSAISNVTVDKTTNTITVNFDKDTTLTKYAASLGDEKESYWYAIIIDTGIPLEYITNGTRYNITNGGEKNYSIQLKNEGLIKDTEILIYLSAEDAETPISFIDSRTGDEHFYTVKVKDAKLGE